MEEQLETFRATSAAQMKTSEQQTLDMLRGLVEKMEKSRGEMKIDQQAVREQVNNIETALEGQLSQKMRETMDKLMDLASEAPASGDQACFYALFIEAVLRYTGDVALATALLVDAMDAMERADSATEDQLPTALRALLAGGWLAVEALCRAAGNGRRAIECERAYHRARKSLQAAWCEERGLFAEADRGEVFDLQTNALVLYFDLAEAEQRSRVAESLSVGEFACAADLWQANLLAGALWRAGEDEFASEEEEGERKNQYK